MGIFKWVAKASYNTSKDIGRAAGRSIARDIRDIGRAGRTSTYGGRSSAGSGSAYEHYGCNVRHRTYEAMMKCEEKGNRDIRI